MKKITLAVAVAAALGSSIASAQTSVQLYGVADAGIAGVDRGDTAAGASLSNFQITNGVQSASRFGIRGSEDLGGGLKAIFAAEAQWNVDDGTGGATGGGLNFARRSVVGLGGSFGTVLLGRDYLPAYHAGVATDVFSYGMYGTAYLFGRTGGYTVRASNAIHYTSPSWGGLVLRAAFGSGERYEAPKSGGNVGGASLVYTGGPFTASAYFQQSRPVTAATPTVPAAYSKNKEYGVGLGYKMSAFRVAGGWGRSELSADNTNFDAWNLGVGVKLGAGELLAGFQRLTTDGGRNAAIGAGGVTGLAGTEGKANVYSIAYTYPMSKRTNVYASFGYTDNKEGSALGLATNNETIGAAAAGQKIKALGLGVRHTF